MPKVEVKDPGYKIVGVKPGPVVYNGREIDLSIITKKEALTLAKDPNFSYIEETGK